MKHTEKIRLEIPMGLRLAIEYFQSIYKNIPEDHRENATLDLDIEGEGWSNFTVRFLRDATPEEIAEKRRELQYDEKRLSIYLARTKERLSELESKK